jgi:hypothetical protein
MLEPTKYFSKFFSIKQNLSKVLFLSSCAILLSTESRAQYTDIINSNTPGNTMGAYTVGEAVYQLESFFSMDQQQHPYKESSDYNINDLRTSFRFGFKERVELIYEFGYRTKVDHTLNINTKGISENRFGFKVLIYDPHQFAEPDYYSWKNNHRFVLKNLIPVVSVYAGLNVHKKDSFFNRYSPFDPSSETYSTLYDKEMLILQQHLSPYWVLVTNFSMDKPASNREYSITSTLVHSFRKYYRLSVFVEGQSIINDYYADELVRAGGAYLINNNIQVDAFFGTNFKDTPSRLFFGLGASIRVNNHFK